MKALVVMLAFCSLPSHHCGLASKTGFKTQAQCEAAAKKLDGDRTAQAGILKDASVPPPYATKAACGTKEQADQITSTLQAWAHYKPHVAGPESPSEADPYPNGG